MSAWAAKLPRLCRYTAPHEAMIVYNLCLYLEAKGWKVTQTDAGPENEREDLKGETPEARAQQVAELVGDVDDMLTVFCVSPAAASRFMLVGGNGVDVIHDHGTRMSEAMDAWDQEAAHLFDDRSTAEVLGVALARVAELEAKQAELAECIRTLVGCAEPHRDRVEIKAARVLLSGNRAPVPG